MWDRRASGCEETGDMPRQPTHDVHTNPSPQKSRSVTWADQEPAILSEILQNPRHSDGSYYSTVTSRNGGLDPPTSTSRRRRSLEVSPTPKPTQFASYVNVELSSGGLVSLLPSSLRPPPEGTSTAAVFPSPHGLRRSLPGSIPPSSSSPTSHLSSTSSRQSSGVPPVTRSV